jgi:excisionase family DNA binding protein
MTSDTDADRQTHHQIVAAVERRTLTVEEAARELGIGRNTAYLAVRRGEIPTISIGRRLLVPRDALERMLAGEGAAA